MHPQNKLWITTRYSDPWTSPFNVPGKHPQSYPQLKLACVSKLELVHLRINIKCSLVLLPSFIIHPILQ